MIREIQNRAGIRCDQCHTVPPTWWSSSCAACGFTVAACARCATRTTVEETLGDHARSCPGLDAAQRIRDVTETFKGAVGRMMPPTQESFTRHAAKVGARIGARRGKRGEQMGALAGAALGALSDHVLGKPEMQPAVKLAKGLIGVAAAVGDALKK